MDFKRKGVPIETEATRLLKRQDYFKSIDLTIDSIKPRDSIRSLVQENKKRKELLSEDLSLRNSPKPHPDPEIELSKVLKNGSVLEYPSLLLRFHLQTHTLQLYTSTNARNPVLEIPKQSILGKINASQSMRMLKLHTNEFSLCCSAKGTLEMFDLFKIKLESCGLKLDPTVTRFEPTRFYTSEESTTSTTQLEVESKTSTRLEVESSRPRKKRQSLVVESENEHETISNGRTGLMFYYPFEGKHQVSCAWHDIDHLVPGEFLNDVVIEFYLKYLVANLVKQSIVEETHVFNTFFYSQLTAKKEFSYENVGKWTRNVNIFSKKYLIVPINENLHWYLAVIYNPGALLLKIKTVEQVIDQGTVPSDISSPVKKISPTKNEILITQLSLQEKKRNEKIQKNYEAAVNDCKIIIFDSFGHKRPKAVHALQYYLKNEAQDKLNSLVEPSHLGIYAKVPQQDNYCDCGIFLLHFAQTFLSNPELLLRDLLGRTFDRTKWNSSEIPRKRKEISRLMLQLEAEFSKKPKNFAACKYIALVPSDQVELYSTLASFDSVHLVEMDSYSSNSELDSVVKINLEAQTTSSWALDRIDQRSSLNHEYRYLKTGGEGVQVFVLDTGVNPELPDFQGRVKVANDSTARDLNGHGTFVASLVGSLTYGVAKRVEIVSLKVLNDQGTATVSELVKGLAFIYQNYRNSTRRIVNISAGSPRSRVLNSVVDLMSAKGFVLVVAAGNEADDACKHSPSSASRAIAVAATRKNDSFAQFSNYGRCVNLLAPGDSVAGLSSDGSERSLSGTSFSSPIVAGVLAQYWSFWPNEKASFIIDKLNSQATLNAISGLSNGTVNKLVYSLIN